jgi:hypothetical protein
MRGNSPNITKSVENTIVFIKGHHPTMTAKEIRSELTRHYEIYKLKKRQIPSVRSIQNKLKKPKNKENIQKILNDPLNQKWNISLGKKYGIIASAVPILIDIKQLENNRDDLPNGLTLRKAQWVEYLYPALNGILKRQRPELDLEQRIWRIYVIAEEYSKIEEIYEIKADSETPSPSLLDTSDLDNKFFINEDLSDDSIVDASIHHRLTETRDLLRSLITNERASKIKEQPITKEELQPIWGAFSQQAAVSLNKTLNKAILEIEIQKESLARDGETK